MRIVRIGATRNSWTSAPLAASHASSSNVLTAPAGVMRTYASAARKPGANVSVASPLVTVPPAEAEISTEPAGGPRALQGCEAGSRETWSAEIASSDAPLSGATSEPPDEPGARPPAAVPDALDAELELMTGTEGAVSPEPICGLRSAASAPVQPVPASLVPAGAAGCGCVVPVVVPPDAKVASPAIDGAVGSSIGSSAGSG